MGVLVNNIWSIAGSGSRPDVNQMLLQYFINYNMKKGWYLTYATDHHRQLECAPAKACGRCHSAAAWEES